MSASFGSPTASTERLLNNELGITNPPINTTTTTTTTTALSHTSSWDELRKAAKLIEFELDNKLADFSKLAGLVFQTSRFHSSVLDPLSSSLYSSSRGSSTMTGEFSSFTEKKIDQKIEYVDKIMLENEDLINKLSAVIDRMSVCLEYSENPRGLNSYTTTISQHLQRHRDLLYDYTKEFKRTKTSYIANKERSRLLQGQLPISSTAPSSSSSSNSHFGNLFTPTEYLLSERNKMDASHRTTEHVIDVAHITRDNLLQQRQSLYHASNRSNHISNIMPNIQGLIRRINLRRKRETLILALVVVFCLILCFLFIR